MPKISPRCSVNEADPGSRPVTSRIASPRRTRRTRKQIVNRLSDHQRDDVVVRCRGRGAAAGIAAVSKHDEPIGNGLHFLDEVRDVDDGVPLRLQMTQELEQVLDIGAPETAGRFVEHQHAASDGNRARDFHDLLRRNREAADDGVG